MIWRARPLTGRLRRRLTGLTLQQAAAATEQWAPGSKRTEPAAIALPGEFGRALAMTAGRDVRGTADLLTGGQILHPPTFAYRLDDAVLANGCVYAGGTFDRVTQENARPLVAGKVVCRDEAVLCTDVCSGRYFGDWLMTGLPLELLVARRGMEPLVLAGGAWPNEADYRARVDLPRPRPPASPTRFDRLWLVDDRGMNDDRLARYHTLRERAAGTARGQGHRVLIDRGWSGATHHGGAARVATNMADIRQLLLSRGFRLLTPETSIVAELADALAGARICVGLEGSALTHATMLMPPGGALLVIQPPRVFSDALKNFTDAVGLRYSFVVGDDEAGEFRVDQERLLRTLDLVEGALP